MRDGGPAFPQPGFHASLPGMTLRDYFAGQAITGILASEGPPLTREGAVKVAYLVADAMLAERDKQGAQP